MLHILLLAVELAAVFVIVPLLVYRRTIPNLPIPYLLVAALLAFLLLWGDPAFNVCQLASWGNARAFPATILIRDAVCLVGLGIAGYLLAPQLLFSLIRSSPRVWALIFVLYPLVSIYPQELLYRAFFFHRYESLFGRGWGMMVASAMAFGFVHIYFQELAGCGAELNRWASFLFHLPNFRVVPPCLPGPRHLR